MKTLGVRRRSRNDNYAEFCHVISFLALIQVDQLSIVGEKDVYIELVNRPKGARPGTVW